MTDKWINGVPTPMCDSCWKTEPKPPIVVKRPWGTLHFCNERCVERYKVPGDRRHSGEGLSAV